MQVPEKKLKQVMADKELYKVCAVEVKRQIWQDNQALFGDEVSPLLKQYIVEKEAALFSSDLSILHNFFSPSPKTRRQGEVRAVEHITLEFLFSLKATIQSRIPFEHFTVYVAVMVLKGPIFFAFCLFSCFFTFCGFTFQKKSLIIFCMSDFQPVFMPCS